MVERVVVVGGGRSAVLVAAELLRQSSRRFSLDLRAKRVVWTLSPRCPRRSQHRGCSRNAIRARARPRRRDRIGRMWRSGSAGGRGCASGGPDRAGAREPAVSRICRRTHWRSGARAVHRESLGATPEGALVGGDGRASEWLFAIGPLLKGALWETTAVPEIRAHAAILAGVILNGSRRADPRPEPYPTLPSAAASDTSDSAVDETRGPAAEQRFPPPTWGGAGWGVNE